MVATGGWPSHPIYLAAVREYVEHHNAERSHQGVRNELIAGRPDTGTGVVVVRERLGGLLEHYRRAA